MRELFFVVAIAGCGAKQGAPPPPASGVVPQAVPGALLAVSDFDVIADPAARSRALFGELARVITHPRCINCHPAGDVPHQRMLEPHDPPVVRGPDNRGVAGMQCSSCHQDANQELTRVPGAPDWHLAPIEMAWVGKSVRAICEQLKDPARNGGKTLAQLVEHNTHDKLVAWGWAPGADREPAPGTQAQFGALTAAWVATGAQCPEETP